MTIASRTPEGTPHRCNVCGNTLRIEPSSETHDAPCPHCGHLLWFMHHTTYPASAPRPAGLVPWAYRAGRFVRKLKAKIKEMLVGR